MRHSMIMSSGMRAFLLSLVIAVAHSVAWASYVHHLQIVDFESLERHQVVIRWLDWTKTGPGMQPDRFYNLYLRMQALAPPEAPTQLVVQSEPRPKMHAYFQAHRAGDVVDVWVDRRTGRIKDIFPPEAPSFYGLLRVLLPTLGAITLVISLLTILEFSHRRRRPKEN